MVSNFCYLNILAFAGLNNENILRYEYWLRLHGKPNFNPETPSNSRVTVYLSWNFKPS